jgi:hypothetical protein
MATLLKNNYVYNTRYNNTSTYNSTSTSTASNSTDSAGWIDMYNDPPVSMKLVIETAEKIRKEKQMPKQQPHEIAKIAFIKLLLQQERILRIKEGNMLLLIDGNLKISKPILGHDDMAACNTAGLWVAGTCTTQNIKAITMASQKLVILCNALGFMKDDFMIRANCIHEAMCLISLDSNKSTIAIVEDKIDEDSLKQLMHFAGCKNIERVKGDIPGIVMMASLLE